MPYLYLKKYRDDKDTASKQKYMQWDMLSQASSWTLFNSLHRVFLYYSRPFISCYTKTHGSTPLCKKNSYSPGVVFRECMWWVRVSETTWKERRSCHVSLRRCSCVSEPSGMCQPSIWASRCSQPQPASLGQKHCQGEPSNCTVMRKNGHCCLKPLKFGMVFHTAIANTHRNFTRSKVQL